MSDIKAIIFDCFGVLYVDVTSVYFDDFPEKREELHDLNKLSDHGFIDRATYLEAASKITGQTVPAIQAGFKKEHVINQPLINFIRDELKPRYKIGLLSNIGRDWIHDFFSEHDLHGLFNTVVLSSEEGVTKPNPLIYERAAERLGTLPSDCLFIDDREENCAGAIAVGMRAVQYKDMPQLKGALADSGFFTS